MTEWDGRGLPPAARARVDRAHEDGVRSSLLTIGGQAGAASVGFDAVGEVMGCVVQRNIWVAGTGCGVYYGSGRGGIGQVGPMVAPTITSGQNRRWSGFKRYVDSLYHGWDTAMRRMQLEAAALGADGVLGVQWSQTRFPGTDAYEFVVRGTAVRARSRHRPATPFSTDLSGGDFAKLLQAGWVPTELVWGISVAIRHDDYQTRLATRSWSAANLEVPGYTELVTHARADARNRFVRRAAKLGAESATVSSMSLHIWETEPTENHHDHVAEATVVGNGLVKFHRGHAASTDSIIVLPLRRSRL